MAEITSGEGRNKRSGGVKKMKKASTRIDLTPMVDLGFLLITFFIFTTTISRPKAMQLILPDNKGTTMPIKQSGALTILLSSNNSVSYYEGDLDKSGSNMHNIRFSQIRQVIVDKKRNTSKKDMFVIIKPGKASVYKNVVDVLDELTISDVKKYALTDITNDEEARMVTIK